jgi:hypothetical protein
MLLVHKKFSVFREELNLRSVMHYNADINTKACKFSMFLRVIQLFTKFLIIMRRLNSFLATQ